MELFKQRLLTNRTIWFMKHCLIK